MFETNQALIKEFSNHLSHGIIPIMLEQCDIPEKIQNLSYLTCTPGVTYNWRKLEQALMEPNTDDSDPTQSTPRGNHDDDLTVVKAMENLKV